ncbi:glycosyltransferase family 2 protein [bacterium]|nr:glycosyltransferase family 2 protein [bacterium]
MAKRLVSVVIPVYNEANIVEKAITTFISEMSQFDDTFSFEIILAENGSKDDTIKKGEELSKQFNNVSIFHHPDPDYGMALKAGILRAKGEIVVCDEIDLLLLDYYKAALKLFSESETEMIVGSKRAEGAKDMRPIKRRFATFVLNMLLKVFLGFKGTDTHGVKSFLREPLLPVLDKCMVGKDIFASEFVIRAERFGIEITEIPISLDEKRAPSIRLLNRVPKVISNLLYLFWNIRVKNR